MNTSSQEQSINIPANPLRFLLYISKPYKWHALGAMFMVTCATIMGSLSPVIFKMIIDGVTQNTVRAQQTEAVVLWGSIYILTLAAMWVFWRFSGFIGMQWVIGSGATGYQSLYTYVTLHSHTYFINRFAGAIANKISHAAEGTSDLIENIMWGYYERALGLLIATGLMLYTSMWVGLTFLALIIILIIINIPLIRIRRPHIVRYSETFTAFKGLGIDILSNITAVRQYALRPSELKRIGAALDDVQQKDRYQWRLSEWALTINNTLIIIFLSAIMAVMLHLFRTEAVTTGDIVLVLTLIFSSSGSLVFIGNTMGSAIRKYGEIEEGLTAILEPYEINDKPVAKKLTVQEGRVEWKNVSFEFGENKVFRAFNLTINPGERIGLVGPSGAGKTTFVSLLLRQHDIQKGEICIDGQNIDSVTQDSLRKNIAVVPQEPLLFHRTIRENIVYGKPNATKKEIEEVAKKAQAHDFVMSLPDGYETMVGERGVKLSGGQRQRVAIARAMLKDAPILVLDEATSALDSESEVAIQKALHELMEGKTVVAIAHRLSTLREMDRIIVLDQGHIVEDGPHNELITQGGVYGKLWTHQAGGFLQE